jgi:protein-L-isoaspartate(D-aspartate) O-methyltransferase
VIYVNAGATLLPNEWLDAPRQRGRLFAPLTPAVGPGAMPLGTPNAVDCFDALFVSAALFIPCVGARDEASGVRLGESFRRGDAARGSLRRRSEMHQSCWYAGDGGGCHRELPGCGAATSSCGKIVIGTSRFSVAAFPAKSTAQIRSV